MTTFDCWPSLPLEEWQDTFATLHMWTQIVGKIRMKQMPWINHSWSVTLYVTARGLTTSPIPHGTRTFQIDLDFIDHRLLVGTSDGAESSFDLRPMTVADFYAHLMSLLDGLDLHVAISTKPNEVPEPIPFEEDTTHSSYDPDAAHRAWLILASSDRVFREFRARFIGKASPVHFFWGAFDLAVTRFSGRTAPEHPGGVPNLPEWVAKEAYSHEVSSAGFWPGGGPHPFPLFYSYAYPEPEGFNAASVKPEAAFYSNELREFILPYDAVRTSSDPDKTLLDFLQSTYEAAADLGKWEREKLERR